jgi:acid phosphatase type 7
MRLGKGIHHSTTVSVMRSFAQLLVVVATAIITGALAQFDDGYENVTTATTPVQIRLAYQGPTAMMGK